MGGAPLPPNPGELIDSHAMAVTLEQARQELAALAGRMAVANADVSEGIERFYTPLEPLREAERNPRRILGAGAEEVQPLDGPMHASL